MATQQDIELYQGDDPSLHLAVLSKTGAYDLTGQRVEILVKNSRRTPDGDAAFVLSSEGPSPAITITDVEGGLAVAQFTDLLSYPGTFWYRSYVAAATDRFLNRHTWTFGDLIVNAV